MDWISDESESDRDFSDSDSSYPSACVQKTNIDASDEMDRDGLPCFLRGNSEESRLKLQTTLKSSPCGLIVSDNMEPDCPIIYVNSTFEYMSGYTADDILGRNCRFLQYRGAFAQQRHPSVDVSVVSKIRACVDNGLEFTGQILNFRKDGTPVMNKLCLTPIRAGNGQVTHFLGIQSFTPVHLHLGPLPIRHLTQIPSMDRTPASETGPSVSSSRLGSGLSQLSDEVLSQKVLTLVAPRDLASLAMVCRHLNQISCQNDDTWRESCRREWGPEVATVLDRLASPRRLRWARIAREVATLDSASWRKLTVHGSILPSRCNFSACAVGTKLVLFGGEGANMEPMNDTFVLDLAESSPQWRKENVGSPPPGRWGHTLSSLSSSSLVVFGGCGSHGLLNDAFLLDLDDEKPSWRELAGGRGGDAQRPDPRSWHSSCTLRGSKLVVSGGCSDSGRLLSDTFLLDLTMERPMWREVPVEWAPPSRLGHTLSPYGGDKILMFGGLASTGSLRLRSNDAFTIDLAEEVPRWRYVTGSGLPAGASVGGEPPAPRLDHVAVSLPGGRVIIFGGSIPGPHSASQVYLLDPKSERPRWRVLNIPGTQPRFAWGHSTCVMGGTRALVLGGDTGEDWILNEMHELSLVSLRGPDLQQDEDEEEENGT